MEILNIEKLNKSYKDKRIYKNLDLIIEKSSEIVTIWGESGSGKTTLINILLGYDQSYDGKVEVLGKNIKNV